MVVKLHEYSLVERIERTVVLSQLEGSLVAYIECDAWKQQRGLSVVDPDALVKEHGRSFVACIEHVAWE